MSSPPPLDYVVLKYSVETQPPAKPLSLSLTAIQLSYGVPSVILMVMFIWKLRKFPNSFYRLAQMDLVINLLCYINTWLEARLYVYKQGIYLMVIVERALPGFVLVTVILINVFLHMQFCSAIVLAIHRITSIVFYRTYDRFWSKWYLLYALLCVMYSNTPRYFLSGRVSDIGLVNDDTITLKFYYDRVASVLVQTLVFTITYFVLLFFVGIVAVIAVMKTVKNLNVSDRGVSKKLTKIAFAYCFVCSGNLFWYILASVEGPVKYLVNDYLASFEAMVFFNDMMSLSLPYILMAFDSNVRRSLFKQPRAQTVPFVVSSSLMGMVNAPA